MHPFFFGHTVILLESRHMKKTLIAGYCLTMLLALGSCNNGSSNTTEETGTSTVGAIPAPASLSYKVEKVYPHDSLSYTQGLLVVDGQLYESTGGNPDANRYHSWVGRVDLPTGKVSQKAPLDEAFFGEGITILNSKLYQLTWTSKKGFIYDAKTFKKLQEFPLKTEGWGLTHDSSNLIASDGSSNLYFLNPADFSTLRIIGVNDNNGPVNNLNELEFINGFIYANRWQHDIIYKIDPSNGQVVGVLNLAGILAANSKENMQLDKYKNNDAVLNGIAYDAASKKIYVTGKLWPQLFEISIQ